MKENNNDFVPVLDKGYCRLVDWMGGDLTVVNSARVSYDKQSLELTEQDKGLISFLAKHGHTSPFRHATMQFEIYVPLMVARQHWKHVVGSSMQDNMVAWNESSRRYVTEEPVFYVPNETEWRGAAKNSKQGSFGIFNETVKTRGHNRTPTEALREYIELGEQLYSQVMQKGMAPEQARLFLPAYGMYVRYYWTASLQGILHFLNLRLDSHAQYEIQELAKAVAIFVEGLFPESYKAWQKQIKQN